MKLAEQIKRIKTIMTEDKGVVNELLGSIHFYERMIKRWELKDYLRVVLAIPYEGGIEKKHIGMYRITPELRNEIDMKFKIMSSIEVNPDLAIGVIVHRFYLTLNNIIFLNRNIKEKAIREYVERKYVSIYIEDEPNESNGYEPSVGDTLFVVIKNNKAITSYFGKKHALTPEKTRTDHVISDPETLKDFEVKLK